MKQKKNTVKKVNHQNKIKSKRSWLVRLNLWLEKHSGIGMLLDFIMFLAMGATLGVFLFDNHLIPRTYRDFNYLFPLFMNLYLVLNGLYFNVFRVQKEDRASIEYFATVFLYVNAITSVVHIGFGIKGRRMGDYIPALYTLNLKYIWFPIVTYAIFFILAALILFIIKLRKNKRNKVGKFDKKEDHCL